MPELGYSLSSEEFGRWKEKTKVLADHPVLGEKQAVRTAREQWPIAALAWPLLSKLAIPQYFEAAAENIKEDQIAESIVCGSDPKKHMDKIEAVAKTGADHIYFHQVGPDQEGFFRFYEREILPEFGVKPAKAA